MVPTHTGEHLKRTAYLSLETYGEARMTILDMIHYFNTMWFDL